MILTQGKKIARHNSPPHTEELTGHNSKQHRTILSTHSGETEFTRIQHENQRRDPNQRRTCTERPHQARSTNQSATDSNTTDAHHNAHHDAHHDAHHASPKGCWPQKIRASPARAALNTTREGSRITIDTRKGSTKYTDLGTEGLDTFPRKREGFREQLVFRFCGREALDPSTTIYLLYDPPPLDLVRTQPLQVWTPQAELGRTRKRSIEAIDSNERPLIKKKAEGKRSGKFTAICLNSDTPHPNSDPDHPNRDFIRSISELTVTTTPLT